MRPACPPQVFSCKFLDFSRSRSVLDVAGRKAILELEGDGGAALDEYSDRRLHRARCLGSRLVVSMGYDARVRRVLTSLAPLVFLAAGCVLWPDGSGPAAPPMSLTEALSLRDAGEAVLVDVRSPAAYARGHIPGALSIPEREILGRVAELRRTAKLPILYCG